MRVAIFSEVYVPDKNGVATHTKTLKDGLERAGHEVLVVTADKHARVHHIDENNILRCPAMRLKRVYGFGISAPISARRFAMVRAFAPDIIHIQSEFSVGLSGVMIARALNVPLIYTVHTMYDETYVNYIVPVPWVKAATKALYRYINSLSRTATRIITPSHKAKRFMVNDVKTGESKFAVISNAIDWQSFDPDQFTAAEKQALHRQLGTSPDKRTAVFVGRLGREKSIDVLLRFWAGKMKPHDNWQLLIIGGGPEKEKLQRLAESLGIARMVTFTGPVESAEIKKYLSIGDVFMTASLTENNSMSLLEAMAAGLTVLERYDAETADQILLGINGYFFSDSAEMDRRLREIGALSDEELERQKKKVRDSVRCLDTQAMVEKVYSVYNESIPCAQKTGTDAGRVFFRSDRAWSRARPGARALRRGKR